MRRLTAVILLLLISSADPVASATGVILGRVTDADNEETLPGANVLVLRDDADNQVKGGRPLTMQM